MTHYENKILDKITFKTKIKKKITNWITEQLIMTIIWNSCFYLIAKIEKVDF